MNHNYTKKFSYGFTLIEVIIIIIFTGIVGIFVVEVLWSAGQSYASSKNLRDSFYAVRDRMETIAGTFESKAEFPSSTNNVSCSVTYHLLQNDETVIDGSSVERWTPTAENGLSVGDANNSLASGPILVTVKCDEISASRVFGY